MRGSYAYTRRKQDARQRRRRIGAILGTTAGLIYSLCNVNAIEENYNRSNITAVYIAPVQPENMTSNSYKLDKPLLQDRVPADSTTEVHDMKMQYRSSPTAKSNIISKHKGDPAKQERAKIKSHPGSSAPPDNVVKKSDKESASVREYFMTEYVTAVISDVGKFERVGIPPRYWVVFQCINGPKIVAQGKDERHEHLYGLLSGSKGNTIKVAYEEVSKEIINRKGDVSEKIVGNKFLDVQKLRENKTRQR